MRVQHTDVWGCESHMRAYYLSHPDTQAVYSTTHPLSTFSPARTLVRDVAQKLDSCSSVHTHTLLLPLPSQLLLETFPSAAVANLFTAAYLHPYENDNIAEMKRLLTTVAWMDQTRATLVINGRTNKETMRAPWLKIVSVRNAASIIHRGIKHSVACCHCSLTAPLSDVGDNQQDFYLAHESQQTEHGFKQIRCRD